MVFFAVEHKLNPGGEMVNLPDSAYLYMDGSKESDEAYELLCEAGFLVFPFPVQPNDGPRVKIAGTFERGLPAIRQLIADWGPQK